MAPDVEAFVALPRAALAMAAKAAARQATSRANADVLERTQGNVAPSSSAVIVGEATGIAGSAGDGLGEGVETSQCRQISAGSTIVRARKVLDDLSQRDSGAWRANVRVRMDVEGLHEDSGKVVSLQAQPPHTSLHASSTGLPRSAQSA